MTIKFNKTELFKEAKTKLSAELSNPGRRKQISLELFKTTWK